MEIKKEGDGYEDGEAEGEGQGEERGHGQGDREKGEGEGRRRQRRHTERQRHVSRRIPYAFKSGQVSPHNACIVPILR